MHQGKLVFTQLMVYLPLCSRSPRRHKVKDFSCLDQFFAMAFAQFTYRESLRDIEVNLRAQARQLYHMGSRYQTISRNTPVANLCQLFAQHLIGIARPLYAKEPFGVEFDAAVYAFDASSYEIDSYLSAEDVITATAQQSGQVSGLLIGRAARCATDGSGLRGTD